MPDRRSAQRGAVILAIAASLGAVARAEGPLPAPSLAPGKHVYSIPDGYVPPAIGAAGLAELEQAAAKEEQPFYVLLVQRLPAGPRDATASATLRGIVDAWAMQPGFDARTASVFLVSFEGERAYRLMPGSRWRGAGIADEASRPIGEAFVGPARRGSPTDGILAVMRALDEAIAPIAHPEIAAKRAAEEAAARAELQRAIEREEAKEAQERRDRAIGGGVTLAGLVALIGGMRRRKRLRIVRARLDQQIARWSEKIQNASARYVDVYAGRDELLGLDKAEGHTRALYDRVTAEVDDIYTSIKAIEAHVERCRRRADQSGFFSPGGLVEAERAIDAEFEFDTGVLNPADLFGRETKVLRVRAQELADDLDRRFRVNHLGWQRLKQASAARVARSVEELPASLLGEAATEAQAAGVPARWLAGHPLEKAAVLHAEIDALRPTDPLLALERVEATRTASEAFAARVHRLAAALTSLERARVQGPPDVGPTKLSEEDDPAATLVQARAAEGRARGLLASAETDDEGAAHTVTAIEEATALFRRTVEQGEIARHAITSAAEGLAAARGAVDGAEQDRERARARVEAARPVHAAERITPAAQAIDEARADIEAGRVSLRAAEAKLAEGRHLEALRAAEEASHGFDQARAAAARAIAIADGLDAEKVEYERRLADLERRRFEREKILCNEGSYARTTRLDPWTPPVATTGLDWAALTAEMAAREAFWDAEVAYAQDRRAAAEAAAAAAEEAARASASSSSSDSSWSSSSSSDSSWSSSSSDSSWSSGSSSDSGGGWSGGDSGGSSGDSGGGW